jgi:phosphatidate cytidylyltransferase
MIGSITIHPLIFGAVFLLILIKGMAEFYSFTTDQEQKPMVVPGMIAGILVFLSFFLYRYASVERSVFLIIPVSGILLFILTIFRQKGHAINSLAVTLMGIIYVAVPLSLFNGLVYHPFKAGFDYQVGLFLLVIIWLNDTGAYVIGMLIGKHKMFPRISPKKTWEGLAGGLVFAFLASWLMRPIIPDIPPHQVWVLTLAIVVAGTLGDLAESAFKRAAGVKDSGKFMPGHGGLLDRFDSLLFATPIVYLLINSL